MSQVKRDKPQDLSQKLKVKSKKSQTSNLKTHSKRLRTQDARHKTISDHERWMRIALELALKGSGLVSPNPIVGACVVSKGKLVGQGWHKKFGGPHAEVLALRQAGKRAKGAVLYVTLEPCSSWGKTPPCVDAIIRSGVRKVIYAATDPNPKHAGQAKKLLSSAGILVQTGVLAREAEKQNEVFLKWIRTGIPFVTLKMAQTLDGKISTRQGLSKWISSAESRDYVQELRRQHDAVLVGKNTLLADNPRLSVRRRLRESVCRRGFPWRVVIDPQVQIPTQAKIFTGSQAIVLAIAERFLKKAAKVQWRKSVTVLPIREIRGRLDLGQLLNKLGALGISSVLVEGGGETAWSLLSEKKVDRLIWITAPKIFGGQAAKTSVGGPGVKTPQEAICLRSWSVFPMGQDSILEGRF